MKRVATPVRQLDLTLSPTTPEGEIVMSRLKVETDLETGEELRVTYTVDTDDIIRQLKWLDEQAPVFHASSSLTKAEKLMREALMDVWAAVKEDSK